MQLVQRVVARLALYRPGVGYTLLLLLASFVIFTSSASAVIRFNGRSLFVLDPEPGVISKYVLSLTYNNTGVPSTTVGSIDLLFCNDPIPEDPCVAPAGLDASHATLTSQSGVTGYTILSQSKSDIKLTRTPDVVGETPSTYTFDNILNPTGTISSYGIRISDYTSTDTSGVALNVGSVLNEVNPGLILYTQVPPSLTFCLAQQVAQDCTSSSGGNYTDLGALSPTQTLSAQSQMAVGTNASGGFVITANGPTMEAGTNVINALTTPTVSAPGNSQFGINLRANSTPSVGDDPDGAFTNAVPAPNYNIPNSYMYKDGDVVASSPNVSLVRRFTVSYIVNVPPNLRAGVYTTSITFICSGRF